MTTREGFDPNSFNLAFPVDIVLGDPNVAHAKSLAAMMTTGAITNGLRVGSQLATVATNLRPTREPHVLSHDFSPR
ncbi:MAG: hypothetical protein ACOYN3_07220 [Acidimicrobiia bacterium]